MLQRVRRRGKGVIGIAVQFIGARGDQVGRQPEIGPVQEEPKRRLKIPVPESKILGLLLHLDIVEIRQGFQEIA